MSIRDEPQWQAFCDRWGQDPDDPDAFFFWPPGRLAAEFREFIESGPAEAEEQKR